MRQAYTFGRCGFTMFLVEKSQWFKPSPQPIMNAPKKIRKQINIGLDAELYQLAKIKCKDQFGIGLSPLIKMFLRAFVTQKGVGFFVGDQQLRQLFTSWLTKKYMRKNNSQMPDSWGPRLQDIYDMKYWQ